MLFWIYLFLACIHSLLSLHIHQLSVDRYARKLFNFLFILKIWFSLKFYKWLFELWISCNCRCSKLLIILYSLRISVLIQIICAWLGQCRLLKYLFRHHLQWVLSLRSPSFVVLNCLESTSVCLSRFFAVLRPTCFSHIRNWTHILL